jgi:hypothetical protein
MRQRAHRSKPEPRFRARAPCAAMQMHVGSTPDALVKSLAHDANLLAPQVSPHV